MSIGAFNIPSPARSADRLPRSLRDKVAVRLAALQRQDGGWAGRAGGSDPYYTSFALRLADALDVQEPGLWRGAAGFLLSSIPGDVSSVLNHVESAAIARRRLAERTVPGLAGFDPEKALAPFRLAEGYALQPEGPLSCYATFLAWRAYAAAGLAVPWLPAAARAIAARQRDDGGFAEADSAVSGASGTAAALCVMRAGGPMDPAEGRAAAFLAGLQRPDGGFSANSLVHGADLLSTFTALVALSLAGRIGLVRLADAARFVRGLHTRGVWRSCASDPESDVEYSYYGFAALCVLASWAGKTACSLSGGLCL